MLFVWKCGVRANASKSNTKGAAPTGSQRQSYDFSSKMLILKHTQSAHEKLLLVILRRRQCSLIKYGHSVSILLSLLQTRPPQCWYLLYPYLLYIVGAGNIVRNRKRDYRPLTIPGWPGCSRSSEGHLQLTCYTWDIVEIYLFDDWAVYRSDLTGILDYEI